MERLKANFPPGMEFDAVYDTTPFIDESIKEVYKALGLAILLVAVVVMVFLQSWRATLIPLAAVPVAIIGTLAIMLLLGFSLNNLTLFGLVLAVGIVVDDAIVVVENVERRPEPGYGPPLGPAALAGAPLPTWALGGVDAENAAKCLEFGAAGVAVMGAVLASPDPASAFARIQDRLDEVQR